MDNFGEREREEVWPPLIWVEGGGGASLYNGRGTQGKETEPFLADRGMGGGLGVLKRRLRASRNQRRGSGWKSLPPLLSFCVVCREGRPSSAAGFADEVGPSFPALFPPFPERQMHFCAVGKGEDGGIPYESVGGVRRCENLALFNLQAHYFLTHKSFFTYVH